MILIGLFFEGCQAYVSPTYALESTEQTPETFENPTEIPGPQPDQTPTINTPRLPEQSSAPAPELSSRTTPNILNIPNIPLTPLRPRLPQASKFIRNADYIMLTEGEKIGTPCNRYLQRVLQYSGYPPGSYLANDFNIYAAKKIPYAGIAHFVHDRNGSEIERLRRHLWSFPERTPFIMQWSRPGVPGHLAIVERVREKLIIYQASLNKYTARKDQTTVSILLSGYNRHTLSVYANF